MQKTELAQLAAETDLSYKLAQIQVHTAQIKEGSARFAEQEQKYHELKRAQKLMETNLHFEHQLHGKQLDRDLNKKTLQKIIENGGAPSYSEILSYAESISEPNFAQKLSSNPEKTSAQQVSALLQQGQMIEAFELLEKDKSNGELKDMMDQYLLSAQYN